MTFLEILPIALTVLIIGGAVFYLVRQKKKGTKCIGCPYGKAVPAHATVLALPIRKKKTILYTNDKKRGCPFSVQPRSFFNAF